MINGFCIRSAGALKQAFQTTVLFSVMFLPLNAAVAQDATRATSHSEAKVIEEIMVTATKRDTSLQDTGIAISVLGSDELEFRDIKNLEDIENSVPGLKIGSILGAPLINIRGVGLNFISGLGNPGVATHYDGIYLPRAGSVGAASVDMAQVEVLRGPQGTLYGRNSTGGSVNFLSKKPHDEFGAGLTVGEGSYDREFHEAYIEGPVFVDDMALRLYMRRDYFDGYGVNETTGKSIGDNDAVMGHAGLSYHATDNVEVYLSYTRRDEQGAYPYSTALTGVQPILAGLSIPPFITIPSDLSYPTELQTFEDYNIKGLHQPKSTKYTEIGNLTITWDFNGYTLKSITGYVGHLRDRYGSAPEIEADVIILTGHELSHARSQEFNLSSSEWFDGRLNWLLGTYYQVDRAITPAGARISLDEIAGGVLPLDTNLWVVYDPLSKTEDSTSAVFLDGYWSLLDNLRLVAGIRYSKERRELVQTFQPYIGDEANTPGLKEATAPFLRTLGVFAYCVNYKTTKEFTSTDPKLGLEWDTTEDIMMYIQYQTGFKAGGFNTATSCNQFYDPEEIESVEVGIKSTLLDNALTVNAAAFDYDYSDYQVEKVVGFTSLIENAAAASSQGFELEVTYNATHWLVLDLQYSYLDAHYDTYFAVDNFKNTSVISGDAPVEDLSGNRLSRAPQNSVSLGVTFNIPIDHFGIGMAQFRLEGHYSDEVYFREFNADIEKQEEYSTYSAFLSVNSMEDKYTLSLFAKNIGDEHYQVGQIPFDTIKYRGAYIAPPKTVGASIAINFR